MLTDFGFWDILLIAVVSLQATVLAYVYHPKWKAFMLSLPIPFTVAVLAVNRPIDATNVLGMTLLLFFTHGVRVLYTGLRVPIVLSIIAAAGSYCLIGTLLATVVPQGETAFWLSCAVTLVLAVVLLRVLPYREEPGHRTPLPVWLKLPLIIGVIMFLLLLKKSLHGFTTMFPMVGVIGAYEARHSLWTTGRQIPAIMLTMIPMMIVCRLTQSTLGLGLSLLSGWIVFLIVLVPVTRFMWDSSRVAASRPPSNLVTEA
jgi:hypothetical protein